MVYILGMDWRTGFSHSVRKSQDAEGGSGSVPTPGLCTVPPRAHWDFWNSKRGRMGRGPPTPGLSLYVPGRKVLSLSKCKLLDSCGSSGPFLHALEEMAPLPHTRARTWVQLVDGVLLPASSGHGLLE